ALEQRHGLAPVTLERGDRAWELGHTPPAAEAAPGGRRVAVVAFAHGRMALCRDGTALRLADEGGGGEDGCGRARRRFLGLGGGRPPRTGAQPAARTSAAG